jgi:hypothetical protein
MQWIPMDRFFADELEGIQGQTWSRSETSANNDKLMPDVEKGPEEVVAEQSKVPGEKAENKTQAGTSS